MFICLVLLFTTSLLVVVSFISAGNEAGTSTARFSQLSF